MGSKTIGTCAVLAFRAPKRRKRAFGSDFADMLGGIEAAQLARDREPVIALHRAVFSLRNGDGGNRTIRPPVFADEAVRVGEDFVPSGGIERSAVRVLDARVEIERGFFGAARVVDAFFAGQRIDVGGIKIEIAGKLSRVARLRGVRQRDLRK